MTVELGSFTLGVQNLERGMAFYGTLFGWEFDHNAVVSNVKFCLCLAESGAADASDACFHVCDIEDVILRLELLGGMVIEQSLNHSGPVARCADDQGTQFSIRQPALAASEPQKHVRIVA